LHIELTIVITSVSYEVHGNEMFFSLLVIRFFLYFSFERIDIVESNVTRSQTKYVALAKCSLDCKGGDSMPMS
jgi:hypothetical protein